MPGFGSTKNILIAAGCMAALGAGGALYVMREPIRESAGVSQAATTPTRIPDRMVVSVDGKPLFNCDLTVRPDQSCGDYGIVLQRHAGDSTRLTLKAVETEITGITWEQISGPGVMTSPQHGSFSKKVVQEARRVTATAQ